MNEIQTDHRASLGRLSKERAEALLLQGTYTGRPLNGYRNVPAIDVHQVDESKRPLIERAFFLVGVECCRLRHTLSECRRIGLTGPSGRALSLNSLHLTLTNPFYCGRIRTKQGFVRGVHGNIISMTSFDTVQRQLRGRKHGRKKLNAMELPGRAT